MDVEIVARMPHFIIQIITISIIVSMPTFGRESKLLNTEGQKIFSNLSTSIEKSRVKNTAENFNQLTNYRKFYIEQEKLDYFCRENSANIYFKNNFERDEFYRTIAASLQYKMINYSMQSIAEYAKRLEFDSDQYNNLVTGLVGSCSKNLTLYSHRLLKHLFNRYYTTSNDLKLPVDSRETLFEKKVTSIQSENEILVNELYFTTGVFKYACSWGGQVNYLRKMAPLLSSSVVMSYLIREMSGKETYTFNDKLDDKKVGLCKNQICRKNNIENFNKQIVRPVGSSNLNYDFKVAYCQNFRFSTAKYSPDVSVELKEDLKEFDGQENRIIAQFVSLLTRVPDFNIWTSDTETIKKYISISNDGLWNYWAKDFLNGQTKRISYEEALVMKLDKSANLNFIRQNSWPTINFNVVNGEFDKETNSNNMVSLNFDLRFPRKDIKWLYREYKNAIAQGDDKLAKDVRKRLRLYINESYSPVQETLSQFTVNADISKVLTEEILGQFNKIDFLEIPSSYNQMTTIRVNVHIAPFALVAIRNKRIVSDMAKRELKEIKSLEMLNNIDSMAEDAK